MSSLGVQLALLCGNGHDGVVPRCLVTGPSGYVGGRLVPRLLEAGWTVRVLARHPERLRDHPWIGNVEVVGGDATDSGALDEAMRDVDVAYYLLHSLQEGKNLEVAERQMASTFAVAAKSAGVRRIIYLGGLASAIAKSDMSAHMRSRVEVGEILRESGVPTVELRAAVIIGSGSASFEMLRYLTERLPAMVTPRWVRDVLRYLVLAADLPPEVNRTFEIGGPEIFSYQEMMQRYARAASLAKRLILPINVLTPKLSSHWVGLVTPVPRNLARPLVESLRHEAICHEHEIAQWIPDPPEGLVGFDQAVSLALQRIRSAEVVSRWTDASTPGAPSDPLPTDPEWTGGTLYTDLREVRSDLSPEQVWQSLERIGGDNGWFAAQFLWQIRGTIDRLVGGVGLRRGRRDPRTLLIGDAVDFWRVEERIEPRLLRLRAEMRMPGLAWLEFVLEPTEDGGTLVQQRATFVPHGLMGHAYWWSVAPFHGLVFPGMARNVAAGRGKRRRPSRRG